MIDDDHPDKKKVIVVGKSSKDKAALEEGEILEKDDEEDYVGPLPSPPTSLDVTITPGGGAVPPATTARSGNIMITTVDVPPMEEKEFKSINVGSSASAAVADGSRSGDGRVRRALAVVLPSQPTLPPPPPPQARPPPQQVPCPLCNRMFDSYPAMFGHQRVHKDRTYRGAYPPPTFNREGSPTPTANDTEAVARQAAEMLVQMSKAYWEQHASKALMEHGEASSSLRGLALDLNIPLQPETEEKEECKANQLKFDLNRSPPNSEE